MKLFNLFFLLSVVLPSVSLAQDSYLDITITNIKHDKGKIIILVDDNKKSYETETESDAFFVSSIMAKKGTLNLRIPANDKKKYSVLVFHDENLNSKLDTDFFGIPSEGISISNVKEIKEEYKFEKVSVKPNAKIQLSLAY